MKLSIIIPCYNAEKHIERCVLSILSQNDHGLELEMLLCNDGSKDNTLKIIEELKIQHPDIVKIDTHENMGVYKTRNRALDIVEGDYIWLIDADDSIEPNTLHLIEKALVRDIEILNFGYKVENPNKTISKIFPPNVIYPISGLDYLFHNDGRLYLWCNIYKKSFIDSYNLKFLGKSMSLEDFYFNVQAFIFAEKVYALNTLVYLYHYNENSISKKPSLENRLRQGESSINVHLALKAFRDNFEANSNKYKIINTKLTHSVLGFFFSLLKEQYPQDYIKKIYKFYKEEKLYPLPKDSNLNWKAKAFRNIANNKHIFLLLSKINLMRKS